MKAPRLYARDRANTAGRLIENDVLTAATAAQAVHLADHRGSVRTGGTYPAGIIGKQRTGRAAGQGKRQNEKQCAQTLHVTRLRIRAAADRDLRPNIYKNVTSPRTHKPLKLLA